MINDELDLCGVWHKIYLPSTGEVLHYYICLMNEGHEPPCRFESFSGEGMTVLDD